MTDTQLRDADADADLHDDDTADDDGDFDLVELFAPSLVDKLVGARKALIAGGGVLLQGGAMAGLEGTVLQWTQTALAAVTAAAVYRVRNVVADTVWTASDSPAPSDRGEDDEPTDAPVAEYVAEHAEGDPHHEHLPEHAAPDA